MKKQKDNDSRAARPVCVKENLYDVLTKIHNDLAHPGMRAFWTEVSSRYWGIPQAITESYIKQCALCSTHKPKIKQSSSRPIVSTNFLSRVQVDLTYMGNTPDQGYKWICHMRDHFTRFSWTSPLKSKSSVEVAKVLYNVFMVFGAPLILQSDNGAEFTSSIIKELMSMWPRTKIVRGSPRHPQSQGSVERGNAILKTKLAKWMEYNRSKRWTEGLPIVTRAMNVSICRVTNCTPYELVFNKNPQTYYALLDDFDDNEIISEEQLNIDFEKNLDTDFEITTYPELDQHEVDNTGNLVEAETEENDEHSDEEVCWNIICIIYLYCVL